MCCLMSCSSTSRSPGWADLPSEIVVSIAKRLAVAEVIRLRAVCSCWAWALGKNSSGLRQKGLYSPSPWILIPNSSLEDDDFFTFFSIIENRFYRIPSLKQITDHLYHLVSSSQHGWLVTIDNVLAPCFLNPLTRQMFHLPSLLTIPSSCSIFYSALGSSFNRRMFYDQILHKIILISTPLEERIAVAFCGTNYHGIYLLFASVDDDVWSIGPSLPLDLECSLDDVKYNEGDDKLYVLTSSGDVFVLQFKNHALEIVSMVCRPIGYEHYRMFVGYISFSQGDLLLVNEYLRSYSSYNTLNNTAFKIFRLYRASCWAPVDDLGNQALFIGPNNCFALHDVEERKKNKIFFIHYVPTTCLLRARKIRCSIQKFGVFDLETSIVEYLLPFEMPAQPFPILFFPEPKLWD